MQAQVVTRPHQELVLAINAAVRIVRSAAAITITKSVGSLILPVKAELLKAPVIYVCNHLIEASVIVQMLV